MAYFRKILRRRWDATACDSGATAVEFAIVGPIMIALMFWFFDVSYSVYVRNSFNHAVNQAAREIYVDPDRTDSDILADLNASLARFGDVVTTSLATETSGGLDYHVLSAELVYHFKSPPFSGAGITLRAEGRAPVIKYQIEAEGS